MSVDDFTDEQLEISVRAFVDPPYTTCGDGPPCLYMLTRPAEILADRSQWPDHICSSLMEASCDEWLADRMLGVFGPEIVWAWYDCGGLPLAGQVPMPVGRQSFGRSVGLPHRDRLAMFPGNELVAVVVTEVLEQTRITAFGLVDEVPADGGEEYQEFQIVDMRFQIIGDAIDPNVIQFCRNARDWWRTIGLIPTRTGGRKRIELTYEKAADVYRELFDSYEMSAFRTGARDRRPTDNDVADHLEISHRKFYAFIKQWREEGRTWKPKMNQE
jgi:hypothetical protein